MTIQSRIDYSAKDYLGFREFLMGVKREVLPKWTSESPNDLGVALIELFSYMGDILSYYGDRAAGEAFLSTATQRRSVLALAAQLDYTPVGNSAATGTVQFTATADTVVPEGTQIQTAADTASSDDVVIYETDEDLTVAGGTTAQVSVTEGVTVTREEIGTSSGEPLQEFALLQYPVISGTVRIFVDEGGGVGQWTGYAHLIDAGNQTQAYELRTDERDAVVVLFGDDVNGRIPAIGATIYASYRVGGGERGNQETGRVNRLVSPVTYISAVTNPFPMTGGAEAESLSSIRTNAPKSLTALTRAVSLSDYANISLQISGVSKTQAVNTGTDVTVYAAPSGGGVMAASVRGRLEAHLDRAKMINHTVTVTNPTYVPVDVTVDVTVLETHSAEAVESRVAHALTEALVFDNVDIAESIRIGRIHLAIQNVEGVDYGRISLLSRDGAVQADDVVIGDGEIAQPGTITVNVTGGITVL